VSRPSTLSPLRSLGCGSVDARNKSGHDGWVWRCTMWMSQSTRLPGRDSNFLPSPAGLFRLFYQVRDQGPPPLLGFPPFDWYNSDMLPLHCRQSREAGTQARDPWTLACAGVAKKELGSICLLRTTKSFPSRGRSPIIRHPFATCLIRARPPLSAGAVPPPYGTRRCAFDKIRIGQFCGRRSAAFRHATAAL
jgi:hypothetical protein